MSLLDKNIEEAVDNALLTSEISRFLKNYCHGFLVDHPYHRLTYRHISFDYTNFYYQAAFVLGNDGVIRPYISHSSEGSMPLLIKGFPYKKLPDYIKFNGIKSIIQINCSHDCLIDTKDIDIKIFHNK